MNRVFIRTIAMLPHNYAFVMEDEDGDYNIYINENVPDNKLREIILHELMHIAKGHLEDDKKLVKRMEEEAECVKDF